jgi:hypothetical protein
MTNSIGLVMLATDASAEKQADLCCHSAMCARSLGLLWRSPERRVLRKSLTASPSSLRSASNAPHRECIRSHAAMALSDNGNFSEILESNLDKDDRNHDD